MEEVKSYYKRSYGQVPKEVVLYREEGYELVYTYPEPPQTKKEILNWDKPQSKQKWMRTEVPECWDPDYVDSLKSEFGNDPNWWRNDKNSLPEDMADFAEQEWDRRMNGLWFYNNGKVRYMTGNHYFYLCYFNIDIGYPHYRDVDRRWFLVWNYCEITDYILGLIFPKRRRDGATYRCLSIGLEYASRTPRALFGIQSLSEKHARENHMGRMLVPAWRRLPLFFSPLSATNDDPKKEIHFKAPARRIGKKFGKPRRDMGLESVIEIGLADEKYFDGAKVHRYFRDEGGKTSEADIVLCHNLLKPSILQCGGKMLWPSTVEEVEGRYKDKFWDLFCQSNPKVVNSVTKETTSGLIRYFVPCYDGLEVSPTLTFIDEFGDSMIEKAKEYKDARRAHLEAQREWNALSSERRQFPYTIEEAFSPDGENSFFNVENITSTIRKLKAPHGPNGWAFYNQIVTYGNLEFKNDEKFGEVYFDQTTQDKARFWIRNDLGFFGEDRVGIGRNRVRRVPSLSPDRKWDIFPLQTDAFVISADPISHDKDHATSNKLSKAAAHGFRKYSQILDGGKGTWENGNTTEDWVTHSVIFEYYARPDDPDDFMWDMVKACMFFGCEIHVETNKYDLVKFFYRNGLGAFVMNRPEGTRGQSQTSQKIVPGTPMTELMQEAGVKEIAKFIQRHCHPYRIPFIRTLEDLLKMDLKNMTKHDLTVSMMYLTTAFAWIDPEFRKEKTPITDRTLQNISPKYVPLGRRRIA